jgi:hypothetical protein
MGIARDSGGIGRVTFRPFCLDTSVKKHTKQEVSKPYPAGTLSALPVSDLKVKDFLMPECKEEWARPKKT